MVCALLVLTACDSDPSGPKPVTTADAYIAAIRWYVASLPAPGPAGTDSTESAEDAEPLVVFIAPSDGVLIDADAQVAVLAELDDMSESVSVVFEDVRDDAIDLEAENQPVKDNGVLLLVGKVVEGPPPVEVAIEVYRHIDDDESFQMRIIRAGSDDYEVTAVTQLEQN